MFKRKSRKMIEATERKLELVLHVLKECCGTEEEQHGEIYESLIAQKVILKELLREFKQIEGS